MPTSTLMSMPYWRLAAEIQLHFQCQRHIRALGWRANFNFSVNAILELWGWEPASTSMSMQRLSSNLRASNPPKFSGPPKSAFGRNLHMSQSRRLVPPGDGESYQTPYKRNRESIPIPFQNHWRIRPETFQNHKAFHPKSFQNQWRTIENPSNINGGY